VVADAREGVDRLRRDPVQDVTRVAEPLGENATGLEMKLGVLLVGDLAVHLLDLGLELGGLYECGGVELRQILGGLHGVPRTRVITGHPDLLTFAA